MDEISKQIEQMAERMEKSSSDFSTEDLSSAKLNLFNVIKSLGSEGLKKKLPSLNEDEKKVLKAALEEMTLTKAVSFDKEADSAKTIKNKIDETVIQEEIASDDADEKLVKPEASDVKHQGTPTEGWDGQVIKSEEILEKKQGVPEGVDPKKWERGVKKLKNKKGIDNPYAVINATMKKSDLELLESQLDQVIEKAMEKCSDKNVIMKKLKDKGMDEAKVQGAMDKYEKKKEVKKSEEIEKGKMKEAREEAKEKIMAMEEKEHGSKDPKKIVEEEKKEKKMMKKSEEDVEKAKKMLKEEDQLGDAPEMNEKPMGKKEAAPNIEDNAKASKDAQKDVKNTKVKKSVTWEDDNRLFKSNVLGRNHSFNLESFVNETIKSAEASTEEVKKSEDKEDLNDIIAKSEDRSWDQIRDARRLSEHKTTGTLVKSFDDVKDIAATMGISEEEARKILGE